MYTYLYKEKNKEDWLDISCLVNSSNTAIVNGLCTRDFTSTTNTASFEVIPAPAYMGIYKKLMQDIVIAQGDMSKTLEAKILIDDEIVASGYIDLASVTITSTKVPGKMKISIRDYIIDLDKTCKANIVREGLSTLVIVEELLEMAGIKAKLYSDDNGAIVNHFVITEEDGNTFREIIDTLLFEKGNKVLYRDPATGNYMIRDVLAKEEPTKIVSYLINKSLKTTSKIWDNDGVSVKYPTIESKPDMAMYIDSASTDAKGAEVGPGNYYPQDGDINPIYQDYRKDILDYAYNSKISRRQNGDLDLLYVKDAHVELSPKEGFSQPVLPDVGLTKNPAFYPRKAQCLLRNDTKNPIVLKRFDIMGTAVYRNSLNTYTAPAEATKPIEYECSYIESEEEATSFAAGYLNLCRYGSTIASWTAPATEEAYPIGSAVIVRHKADTLFSQGFTVISVELVQDGGILERKYVAIATSKYNQYKGVVNTSQPSTSNGKRILIDLQQFYLSTDPVSPKGGEWLDENPIEGDPNPEGYLFTRRYVKYLDGTEYISPAYKVSTGKDDQPVLALAFSGLIYRYDEIGHLNPPDQNIVASVIASNLKHPLVWKVNGVVVPGASDISLSINPAYMEGRVTIDVEVSAGTLVSRGTIVKVMDGKDYVPIVQYRYGTSSKDPNSDHYVLKYGDYTLSFSDSALVYGFEEWSDTVPTGDKYEGMYLWKRTWSYERNVWLYELISGQKGDTLRTTFEYGLSTSPVTCNVTQWSDQMPQWYMGYYIWYRNRYTNETTGQVSYDGILYYDKAQTEALMAGAKFSFYVPEPQILINGRVPGVFEVHLNKDIVGYDPAKLKTKWITVPADLPIQNDVIQYPQQLYISSLSVTLQGTYNGQTLSFTREIPAKNITSAPMYLGVFETDPTVTAQGSLIYGDYYLWKKVDGNTVYINPKVYTAEGWQKIDPNTASGKRMLIDMISDVYGDSAKNHIGTEDYDFFKNVIADNIAAKSIGAREIDTESLYSEVIKVGNRIVSGGYTEEGEDGRLNPNNKPGFYANSKGEVKLVDADIKGVIESDALTTINKVSQLASTDVKSEYSAYWQKATCGISNDPVSWSKPMGNTECTSVFAVGDYIFIVDDASGAGYNSKLSVMSKLTKQIKPVELSYSENLTSIQTVFMFKGEYIVCCSTQSGSYIRFTSTSPMETWSRLSDDIGINTSISEKWAANAQEIILQVLRDDYELVASKNSVTDWTTVRPNGFKAKDVIDLACYGVRFVAITADSIFYTDSVDGPWTKVTTFPDVKKFEAIITNATDFVLQCEGGTLYRSTNAVDWQKDGEDTPNGVSGLFAWNSMYYVTADNRGKKAPCYRAKQPGSPWKQIPLEINIGILSLVGDGDNFYMMKDFKFYMNSLYDYSPICAFFSQVIPKIKDPRKTPSSEPLWTLHACTGTVNDKDGRSYNIKEMKASPSELIIVAAEEGKAFVFNADNQLSWNMAVSDLVIGAIDASASLGDMYPKDDTTDIGSQSRPFNNAYMKNIGDSKVPVEMLIIKQLIALGLPRYSSDLPPHTIFRTSDNYLKVKE